RICAGLEPLGIILDDRRNAEQSGKEGSIGSEESRTAIWVVPTNEELIVARATVELLNAGQ
ncbi:MAG TPA: acetate/propionate family kinase, partial [bacterium]|nr:acetate/propionate family kinase [bacterium]